MAEPATKLPSKTEAETPARVGDEWPPLANLRREIDRLFEDFGFGARPPRARTERVRHRAVLAR